MTEDGPLMSVSSGVALAVPLSTVRRPGAGLVISTRLCAGLAFTLFAGCSAPPQVPPSAPESPPTVEPSRDLGLERFVAAQRLRAEAASSQGRWVEAELAYEALTLLHPDFREALDRTRSSREQAVARGVGRAQAAQARGDAGAAERAWLEVLALDPHHAGASHALRALEADRNRAAVVGRFASVPGMAPNGAAAMPKPRGAARPAPPAAGWVGAPLASPATPQQQNTMEHASLLAGQGELDAAIGLLIDFTQASPTEQPPRMLLANLLVQRSTRHQSVDRASAVADLELALKFNPALESARLRLRQLRGDGRP